MAHFRVKFVRRFIYNCRTADKRKGNLIFEEVKEAENILIGSSQKCLGIKKAVTDNLDILNPFIDDKGVLSVGGRLNNASVCYEQKHPAILQKHSELTT